MNRVNLNGVPVANGTPAPAARKKGRARPLRPARPVRTRADTFRLAMTVTLGVWIPLLSLAMSKLAGTLAQAGLYALAAFAFVLMLAVLGVSLSDVAWAVRHITRSKPVASTALAVALDLSLVLTELCHVYAEGLGLGLVCYAVMGSVAAISMALNVYAFLFHD